MLEVASGKSGHWTVRINDLRMSPVVTNNYLSSIGVMDRE